jgi:hypothetical protein
VKELTIRLLRNDEDEASLPVTSIGDAGEADRRNLFADFADFAESGVVQFFSGEPVTSPSGYEP